MRDDGIHSYEPAQGHGLRHDPFNAIVSPRPIGWISSRRREGRLSLAPYSFLNAFDYEPPILGFSSIGWKDGFRTIDQTGEFAWNLATRALAEAMNQSAAHVGRKAVETWLALGEVVAVRIDETLLREGVHDTAARPDAART